MSGNILEYVKWRGDISFDAVPFNDVDALVFAQLSYNKLEGLLSEDFNNGCTLRELVDRFSAAPDYEERSNLGFMINPLSVDLLFECGNSKRFSDVRVTAWKSVLDEEKCEQFAAVTFSWGKNAVIAYRGTDDYVIGWKEDFNISYLDPVPAQADALEYLLKAAKHFKKQKLYLTGQSKGGNLALYAGVKAPEKLKKRIFGIYNLDGPGMAQEFFETSEYRAVEKKIVFIFPENDVVGMFFKHGKNYRIIESSEEGIREHDSMSWQVIGSQFVAVQDFTKESKIFEKSFNEWADNMSPEDKKCFSDALFDILQAPGYKTNLEISENALIASKDMLVAYSRMDSKTKKNVKRIISDLVKVIKQEIPIFKPILSQK